MANRIDGLVVSISETGGLVSDIDVKKLTGVPRDESVSVQVGGHKTIGIFGEQHGQPESTLIAILSDSGALRIELTGISISEMLGLKVGEKVVVQCKSNRRRKQTIVCFTKCFFG